MNQKIISALINTGFLVSIFFSWNLYASGTMKEEDIANVDRTRINSEAARNKLQQAAGLLANYEINSNKLIAMLHEGATSHAIRDKANELIDLSENIIASARFRLPQCDEYLAKTLALRPRLSTISHASLEKDYHHDGALPAAGEECYHTKDLFVHPATVQVLTRDDPALSEQTRSAIEAEIAEVLAHTELVRKLVIY